MLLRLDGGNRQHKQCLDKHTQRLCTKYGIAYLTRPLLWQATQEPSLIAHTAVTACCAQHNLQTLDNCSGHGTYEDNNVKVSKKPAGWHTGYYCIVREGKQKPKKERKKRSDNILQLPYILYRPPCTMLCFQCISSFLFIVTNIRTALYCMHKNVHRKRSQATQRWLRYGESGEQNFNKSSTYLHTYTYDLLFQIIYS